MKSLDGHISTKKVGLRLFDILIGSKYPYAPYDNTSEPF